MKNNSPRVFLTIGIVFLCFGIVKNSDSMGLRSFVALPVEKGGAVMRLALEHTSGLNTGYLMTSLAYGLTVNQTLLFGLPYRISPAGKNRQSDVSILYRRIAWQKDSQSGTERLGLLGGMIVPTTSKREAAVQAGFIFSHVKNRHKIDIDALHQLGINTREDRGRYDLSWQYRLIPSEYPDWGVGSELNSVLELNGRWTEGDNITHQLTTGLQWVHQEIVIEGGVAQDINNAKRTRYILSTRFHF